MVQAAWARSVPLGVFNDDALHPVLARSLWGGSFILPDGFATPVTDPLPGFALLLMPFVKLVEPRWELLRWLSLGFSWVLVWLTWKLARRYLEELWARAAAFLVAVNTVFLIYCGTVLPDIPYTALSLALLLGLNEKASPARLAALGLAAGFSSWLRPHGMILVGSLALALLVRASSRKAAAFALTAAVLPLGWAWRNHALAGTTTGYWFNWRSWMEAVWEPRDQLLHAARLAATFLGEGLLGLVGLPFVPLLLAGLGVAALAAAGAVRRLRARPDTALFAISAYLIGLLVLHLTWSPELARYLLPALPLVWILVLLGAKPSLQGRPWLAGALALVAALSLRQGVLLLKAGGSPDPTLWPETMAFVREKLPPDARVQSVFDGPVMLLTGRPSIPLFRQSAQRDHWLAQCLASGVTHVLLDESMGRWSTWPARGVKPLEELSSWSRGSPYIRPLYRNEREAAALFELRHPRPRDFVEGWKAYAGAVDDYRSGRKAGVEAKLREAVRLEPRLAFAWAALADLEEEPRKREALFSKAAAADPSSEVIAQDLARAKSGAQSRRRSTK